SSSAESALRLPGYAVPLFVRVVDELETTSTFKSRKVELRKQGYSPQINPNPHANAINLPIEPLPHHHHSAVRDLRPPVDVRAGVSGSTVCVR
uniref:hypothetical protein n=1 Tax=Nocardia cyriacigeorgica TaxID=135487 RepID=UPI0024554536